MYVMAAHQTWFGRSISGYSALALVPCSGLRPLASTCADCRGKEVCRYQQNRGELRAKPQVGRIARPVSLRCLKSCPSVGAPIPFGASFLSDHEKLPNLVAGRRLGRATGLARGVGASPRPRRPKSPVGPSMLPRWTWLNCSFEIPDCARPRHTAKKARAGVLPACAREEPRAGPFKCFAGAVKQSIAALKGGWRLDPMGRRSFESGIHGRPRIFNGSCGWLHRRTPAYWPFRSFRTFASKRGRGGARAFRSSPFNGPVLIDAP
jgi:hypothetical protein